VFGRAAVPPGVEELLVLGRVAVRESSAAAWRVVTGSELTGGLALRSRTLDLATPTASRRA
jgi:hypothetical protein